MIPSRTEVIRAYRQHGGRVAGVLPVHSPRALLRAFDILPVEIWGPPGIDPARGAAHVQPYICSIDRNSLSFILDGPLSIVDLLVVPHACDSLQGLGSLLLDFIAPGRPVLPLYVPRGGARSSDLSFLAAEFRSLYHRLAEWTGCQPGDEELMASIEREEAADGLLARLHRERRTLPLTQSELYRLIRSREFLPAEQFSSLAEDVLAQAREAGEKRGVPIVLSGIVPEPMELFAWLDEIGGYVAADDLACCGRRLYPVGESADPFVRMAERILGGPPDSTRGSPIAERLAHLVRLARESGAKGVVFYSVKFCEPELFYLPTLRKGLQSEGIPSAVVESDLNDGLTASIRTRLEAFLEMLN